MCDIWNENVSLNSFYNINDLMLGIIKPSYNVKITDAYKLKSDFEYVAKINKNKLPQILNFTTDEQLYLIINDDFHSKFIFHASHSISFYFIFPYFNVKYGEDLLQYYVGHLLNEPFSFKLSYCNDTEAYYILNGVTEDSAFFDYYLNLYNIVNNTNSNNKLELNNKDISNIRCHSEYFTWRNKVLRRDNDKCVLCGFKKHLHVHHIFSLNEYPELATDTGNGITLCKYCHNKLHSNTDKKKVTPMDLVNFMKEYC